MFRKLNVFVYSEGNRKLINTICGQNVEFLTLNEVMHTVNIVL
jgi:hypothetical protein